MEEEDISFAPQSSIPSTNANLEFKQTPENQGIPIGMTKGDMLEIKP